MTGYLEGSCSIQLSYGVKANTKNVGVAGFEPTTFCSQSRRDTGLRYTPKNNHLAVNPDSSAPWLIRLIGTKVRQRRCPGNS